MPAQMQLSLNNMSLIITIILWGIVHGGGAPCTVNGVAGYRFGSAPCVAFKVTPTPKQLLLQMKDDTIHTLGIAEHVEMNIAGGGKKEWIISGITSGGASFENSGTTKTLTATDISKSLSAAGHTAHMSAYNRFDYYSGYNGDYGAYDDQALYDEAWQNLQTAKKQFAIAQRLMHRGQKQSAQMMRGQRLMRYGGY